MKQYFCKNQKIMKFAFCAVVTAVQTVAEFQFYKSFFFFIFNFIKSEQQNND